MIKRIIICALCIFLAFSASAFAQEDVGDGNSQTSESLMETMPPQGGRPVERDAQMPPIPDNGNAQSTESSEDGPAGGEAFPGSQAGGRRSGRGGFGEEMQGGFQPESMGQRQDGATIDIADSDDMTIADFVREYPTAVTSLAMLAFGFVFVIFYKRKKY